MSESFSWAIVSAKRFWRFWVSKERYLPMQIDPWPVKFFFNFDPRMLKFETKPRNQMPNRHAKGFLKIRKIRIGFMEIVLQGMLIHGAEKY